MREWWHSLSPRAKMLTAGGLGVGIIFVLWRMRGGASAAAAPPSLSYAAPQATTGYPSGDLGGMTTDGSGGIPGTVLPQSDGGQSSGASGQPAAPGDASGSDSGTQSGSSGTPAPGVLPIIIKIESPTPATPTPASHAPAAVKLAPKAAPAKRAVPATIHHSAPSPAHKAAPAPNKGLHLVSQPKPTKPGVKVSHPARRSAPAAARQAAANTHRTTEAPARAVVQAHSSPVHVAPKPPAPPDFVARAVSHVGLPFHVPPPRTLPALPKAPAKHQTPPKAAPKGRH